MWVTGKMEPGSGWEVATEDTPDSRLAELNIKIESTDGGFLLLVESEDKSVFYDEWHISVEDAEESAKEDFGKLNWEQT